MIVNGTVVTVDIDVEIPKKDGGVYPGSRLTYRDSTGALKEQAFHTNSFKFNKTLKVSLGNLQAGDAIAIDKVKEGEYWKVMAITKIAKDSTANVASTKENVTPKSNWETSEERAKKQVYIIRQSSISSAVALAASLKFKGIGEVLEVAKQFEEFVMGVGSFDDIPDDTDGIV